MAIEVQAVGLLAVDMPHRVMVEVDQGEPLTLKSLIFDRLAADYGDQLRHALFDQENALRPGYAILVNGRNAMQLGGLDLSIEDGGSVLLTAIVSGG